MRGFGAFTVAVAGLLAMTAGTQASAALISGADALKEWNLIVFNNASSTSSVEGRSFIGGTMTGGDFGYNGTTTSAQGTSNLTVVGNLAGNHNFGGSQAVINVGGNINSGSNINMNASGQSTVNVGGQIQSNYNANGNIYNQQLGNNFTSTLVNQRTELINSLGSLSDNLQALSGSTLLGANNTLTINGATNGNLSVFNVSSSTLNSVGQISLTNGNAGTTVINVSGTNISLNDNFLGAYSTMGTNVIWNFYEATDLSVNAGFYGTILAPEAAVTASSAVFGSVVAKSLTQNAQIHPGFQGDLSSVGGSVSATPEPATWAMLILGFGLVGAVLRRRPKLIPAFSRA